MELKNTKMTMAQTHKVVNIMTLVAESSPMGSNTIKAFPHWATDMPMTLGTMAR
jgi:hypothetical protein